MNYGNDAGVTRGHSDSTFRPILFFDGVCNVCNHTVDFLLKRDPSLFLFAPLQGSTAQQKLPLHLTQNDLKTIVLLDEQGIHIKSQALLRTLCRLGGPWKGVWILTLLPECFSNIFYDFFASHRYQWFSKRGTCRIPTPAECERFLR